MTLDDACEPEPAGPARLGRSPALRAAFIAVLAAVPTWGLGALLARAHTPPPIYAMALIQGGLAALAGRLSRMAPWWIPIQLLFPVLLLGATALHPPPAALFGVFLVLLSLYWSTFQTQVPFYPSGPAVSQAVAALLPAERRVRLIDIGSGLGGLVLNVARDRPNCESSGIEMAPLPWLLSSLRARATGSAARFIRGDYERLNFADYDVVFAYLSPAAMAALWRKASREMRPATLLLSYEFSIAAKAPDQAIALTPSGTPLYVWRF